MIPTACLRQRVTIAAFQGATGTGRSWATPGPLVPARIVARQTVTRTAAGVDVTADAQITFRPDVQVPTESRITHGADTYTVLGVLPSEELTRRHSVTVLVEGPR